MPAKLARLAAIVALALVAPAMTISGQAEPAVSPVRTVTAPAAEFSAQRRRVTRIEVYPSRRLYRKCVDWYQLEHRPSGDVITPQMRCRWAYR